MESSLEREFEYYLANKTKLVNKYNGKFIVIKDCAVIGEYDDQGTAVSETLKDHELGTFLVQKIGPGDETHTQTFHSRVAFSG